MSDHDDMGLPPMQVERLPYSMFEEVKRSSEISIYLSEGIGDPDLYTELVHKIRVAREEDIIHLFINSYGGSAFTGIQIINAMKQSKAHVITYLEGAAFSMGSMIFLAGKERIVQNNTQMMIHSISAGTGGKVHEMSCQTAALERWGDKLLVDVYTPFLSSLEIGKVMLGEDIWLEADEIRKRLKRKPNPVKVTRARKTVEK